MRYRKLRIVWSVAWGIAAVLLIALWARSYWWCDNFAIAQVGPVGSSMYGGVQFPGAIGVSSKTPPKLTVTRHGFFGGQVVSFDLGKSQKSDIVLTTRGKQFVTPDWLLVLLAMGVATFPWVHFSKSFRACLQIA
jgi:hypothetical protein